MESGALVLEWLHPSACALQIDFTRAPLAGLDSAAAQFIAMWPFSCSLAGLSCPGDPAPAIEAC